MNKYEALKRLGEDIKNMPDDEFIKLMEELDKEVWGIDSISKEAVDCFLSNINSKDTVSYRKNSKSVPNLSINIKMNIDFVFSNKPENLQLISLSYDISSSKQDFFIVNEDESLAA